MIHWRNTEPPVNQETIAKVESAWDITFPADFIECAMANHGGSPSPNCFFVGEAEEVFSALLCFCEIPEGRVSHSTCDPIIEEYIVLREQNLLPGRVYPFAYDPGGNYLAFDYLTSAEKPSIVFLDHESINELGHFQTYFVCSTFTELLNSLSPFVEDN